MYIGSRKGIDRAMVEEAKVPFTGIHCGKLRRYFSFENFIDLLKLPIGIAQAVWYLTKMQPDVIFSKGGYVSVPVVVAGWLLRKRVILHESDVVPGLANKLCARLASDVCVSFQESVKYFKVKAPVHVVGNPVRKFVTSGRRKEGFKMTGFSRELPIVLVMGGSQGAQQVNKLVWRNLKRLLPICQVVHIAGRAKRGEELDALGLENYVQYDFVKEELPHLYAIADLIVTRAGANSLAEVAMLKKPSVLVPLGLEASRGDQIHNAKVFEKKGVSIALKSSFLDADTFFGAVEELVKYKSKLKEMRKSFEEFPENDAVDEIVELILGEEDKGVGARN